MINILIADDNVEYAIYLMNYINNNNKNIKVCNIAKNGKEVLKILNNINDIDIILLDYKMPDYNGDEIIEMIDNKKKYVNSFIVISGEIKDTSILRKTDLIYSIIFKSISINEILKKIDELSEYKNLIKNEKNIEKKITKEIMYLGYNISHKGTIYLIDVINYIVNHPNKTVEKLEKDIYPIIAIKHRESVHNIKCRINKETTEMYYNCEIEKLKHYFLFEIDTKPKIKTIINTIINKIA